MQSHVGSRILSVDDLLRDHQSLHSDLQIDAWILQADNWTPWGRYQQALRELHGRRAAIETLGRELELAQLDLEDIRRAKPWFGVSRRKRWALRIESQRCKLRDISASLSEHRREFERFREAAESLKAEIGEVTPERRAKLDRETWLVRIRQMAVVDLQCNGRVGPSLLKMIVALPEELRRLAVAETQDQRLIAFVK